LPDKTTTTMEHTSKLHRTAASGAGVAPWTGNKLCFGDCLDILEADDGGRPVVADESVDLVYLDPPFNSKADYNMIFGKGVDKQAQMRAFTDTWRWGGRGTLDVEEIKNAVAHPAHAAVSGLHMALGDSGMMAYLGYMAKRLAVIHRKMKPTASVYLHCDPTASHYSEHDFSDMLPDIPPMLDPMTGRPVQEEFFARK